MKNYLWLSLLFSAMSVSSQAPIDKGMSQINAGLGFSAIGMPLYVGYDHAVLDNVTVGGRAALYNYNNHLYSANIFGIAADANYHFNRLLKLPSRWNLYAGVAIGYFYWSDDVKDRSSGFGAGTQLGGRYYFSKRLGVNLEFSAAPVNSGAKIGITYTLK